MESPYATYRNGHPLFDTFNPADNTLDNRSNALWPANVLGNLWEKPFLFEEVDVTYRYGCSDPTRTILTGEEFR